MSDGDTKCFPLYTKRQRCVLTVPSKMSSEEFALLEQQIENALDVVRETSIDDQAPAGDSP